MSKPPPPPKGGNWKVYTELRYAVKAEVSDTTMMSEAVKAGTKIFKIKKAESL